MPDKKSIAEIVREYIGAHPSIMDCLKYGIINYSALSRMIMDEYKIDNMVAVLIASRRYAEELQKEKKFLEKKIKLILKKSRINIKTKVATVTLKPGWYVFMKLEPVLKKTLSEGYLINIIQGSQGITLILLEDYLEEVTDLIGKENVLRVSKDLVEISVKSPEDIGDTPGVVSYLSSNLSSVGINVIETMSCFMDTIFVVDEKDMVLAFEALNRCID